MGSEIRGADEAIFKESRVLYRSEKKHGLNPQAKAPALKGKTNVQKKRICLGDQKEGVPVQKRDYETEMECPREEVTRGYFQKRSHR